MFVPAFKPAVVKLILPDVLITVTALLVAALSVIPVTAKLAVLLVKVTLPLAVFVAVKLVTTLVAVLNNVPVALLVVNRPPVIIPALVCVI